jgi:hypothetical protein
MNSQSLEVRVIMDEPTEDQSARADRVAALLAGGVPLTLLADLAESNGPVSPAILESEGLPDNAWWEDGDEGSDGAGEASDEGSEGIGEASDEAGEQSDTDPDTDSR